MKKERLERAAAAHVHAAGASRTMKGGDMDAQREGREEAVSVAAGARYRRGDAVRGDGLPCAAPLTVGSPSVCCLPLCGEGCVVVGGDVARAIWRAGMLRSSSP